MRLYCPKAEKNGGIPVLLRGSQCDDGARASLDDRNGDGLSLLVIDLCHAEFFPQNPDRHAISPLELNLNVDAASEV